MKFSQFVPVSIALAFGLAARSAHAVLSISTVYVGDLSNPADPTTGLGTVDYGYSIGKYEVTISQYTAFLNSVAKTDTYGLWNSQMSSPTSTRGISRSGVSGNYSYTVIGTGTRPITYVTWFDTARFVNWLNNGQPTGLQTAATTETGAYSLNGAISGGGFTRLASAAYALPTDAEFYKAAYYQPAATGGDADGYWLFPTRSNTQPNSRNGSTTDPNSANYYYDDGIANGYNGGYAVNNSTSYTIESVLTPVGAFTLASSYYGTFDQGGNAAEWNELASGSSHLLLGGGFGSPGVVLQSDMSYNFSQPQMIYGDVGFRIVAIPEPGSASWLGLGAVCLISQRPRANKAARL
ncbi:MAG: PEP-CTERM sorting domain-containing protein [Verrucomicrobia bacterium]|nr:MAG: PEP-CTERM sorting domain-containing protein [Verrucomicrobiota bacterium]